MALLTASLLSTSLAAHALDGKQVVTSIKLADLTAMTSDLGLSGLKQNTNGNGLNGEYKGIPFGLYLDGCKSSDCQDLVIESFFGKQKLSSEFIAAFNKHYVPRLIAKEDGTVFMWTPLHVESGVTVDYVKYMIALALDASERAQTYKIE